MRLFAVGRRDVLAAFVIGLAIWAEGDVAQASPPAPAVVMNVLIDNGGLRDWSGADIGGVRTLQGLLNQRGWAVVSISDLGVASHFRAVAVDDPGAGETAVLDVVVSGDRNRVRTVLGVRGPKPEGSYVESWLAAGFRVESEVKFGSPPVGDRRLMLLKK
jgi:hypothetical protein